MTDRAMSGVASASDLLRQIEAEWLRLRQALSGKDRSLLADRPESGKWSVLENVRQTRRGGYFFSTGLVTPGAGSIAVPLPDGIDGRDRALTVAVSGILGEIASRGGRRP